MIRACAVLCLWPCAFTGWASRITAALPSNIIAKVVKGRSKERILWANFSKAAREEKEVVSYWAKWRRKGMGKKGRGFEKSNGTEVDERGEKGGRKA